MKPQKSKQNDIPVITERGGSIQVLISPKSVGASNFILGVSILEPNGQVNAHVHDYSHEAFYVIKGRGTISFDEYEDICFEPGDAIHVPKGVAHRINNTGESDMQVVFVASPLAPSPELGHREL